MNAREALKRYFDGREIKYFATLAYSDVREINPRLLGRSGIDAKSVILFLLPYYAGECENLSRYSAARDYHIIIREITDGVCKLLAELFPSSHSRGYGDHSPIDERHAALTAGLGIAGDNGLIINEEYGSYVFIADVITDIHPSELGAVPAVEIKRCMGCGECKRACPTGILRSECDSCLSAITQRKGELTEREIGLMRKYDTVWGCDICQSVCPYNRDPVKTPIAFFKEKRIERLTDELLGSMTDEEFSERAFAWRGRAVVERNLRLLKKR